MYIIFDEQIIDSEEIKDLIEAKSNFKVEKDMCKATKREDVLAYLLTLDVDLIKKEIEEEYDLNGMEMDDLFEEYMQIAEEKAMELEDLMPMYSIMEARSYKWDMSENKIKTVMAVAHTDLGTLRLSDVVKRLLSETD
ncbi:hypothetical protein [Intestinibacter bartlettii]|uniref:Uncharacterized protein n=1 Tax=Intestinibacter bartlettii TaxID=261299 RepID=A0ABS6DWY0_9FIRM|nr:hypothetical protein [Intestinibacter bartlettii]MBU5335747.1 hypothetical protein [Intestinibacter bartlettii]MDO5010576.1 hypothetical protein [Intestinibacter bartlettii]